MPHETKSEYLNRVGKLGKFLYYTGCLSIRKEKKYSYSFKGKKRYIGYLRRIHPITMLLIFTVFLINGFNRENFKSILEETVWF